MPYLVGYATPQDYGAKGDGTTDDTSAVQSAVNAVSSAGGGTVYLPAGTYKLSSAISVPNLVSLMGAGPGATTLKQTSTTANGVTYNPTSLTYASVENLTVQGPGSGSGVGMLVEANGGASSVTSCTFLDLVITGFGSHGIELVAGVGCTLESLNVTSVGGHAFFLSGGTANTLTACYAGGSTSTQQGYQLTSVSYTTLSGCKASACGGGFLVAGGSCNTITGCGAESIVAQASQDGSGFKISGGTGHTVAGCYSNVNKAVAFYVTGSSTAASLIGLQENAPSGATASVKVDAGSTVTAINYSVVTATSFAAGTTSMLSGTLLAARNALIGGTTALGDNGVGELQVADVTTVPTSNPTGGVTVYSQSGSGSPLKMRDTAGNVRGLADAVAIATVDQSVTSSTQTASTYLTLAVEASANYLLEAGVIFANTTSGNNIVFSWTGPTGATMKWNDTGTSADYTATISGTNSYASNAASRMAFFKGNLVTSTTTGSITLTFSASNNTNAVSVLTSSWLRLTRVR